MAALATVAELAARLPFVMDDDETREATGALEDLSDDARHYGKSSWVDAATTPRQVVSLVLKAAGRHMKNFEGFTQSRAGDETLTWTDRGHNAGSAYFTKSEIAILTQMAGVSAIFSVPITAWGPKVSGWEGLVPVEYGGDKFPLFGSDTSPW